MCGGDDTSDITHANLDRHWSYCTMLQYFELECRLHHIQSFISDLWDNTSFEVKTVLRSTVLLLRLEFRIIYQPITPTCVTEISKFLNRTVLLKNTKWKKRPNKFKLMQFIFEKNWSLPFWTKETRFLRNFNCRTELLSCFATLNCINSTQRTWDGE